MASYPGRNVELKLIFGLAYKLDSMSPAQSDQEHIIPQRQASVCGYLQSCLIPDTTSLGLAALGS